MVIEDETRPTLQLPDYECHGAGQEARDVHEAEVQGLVVLRFRV